MRHQIKEKPDPGGESRADSKALSTPADAERAHTSNTDIREIRKEHSSVVRY